VFLRPQRIAVAHQAAVVLQHLRIGQLDADLGLRIDREDAGPKHPRAEVFEQGWIAHPRDDGFVLSPGLLDPQQLPLDLDPVDVHAELADGYIVLEREDVGAFHGPVVGIEEELVDACYGRSIDDGCVDDVLSDFERHVPLRRDRSGTWTWRTRWTRRARWRKRRMNRWLRGYGVRVDDDRLPAGRTAGRRQKSQHNNR
jgi:hypothetical protein